MIDLPSAVLGGCGVLAAWLLVEAWRLAAAGARAARVRKATARGAQPVTFVDRDRTPTEFIDARALDKHARLYDLREPGEAAPTWIDLPAYMDLENELDEEEPTLPGRRAPRR